MMPNQFLESTFLSALRSSLNSAKLLLHSTAIIQLISPKAPLPLLIPSRFLVQSLVFSENELYSPLGYLLLRRRRRRRGGSDARNYTQCLKDECVMEFAPAAEHCGGGGGGI
jgi:hypothetical protein